MGEQNEVGDYLNKPPKEPISTEAHTQSRDSWHQRLIGNLVSRVVRKSKPDLRMEDDKQAIIYEISRSQLAKDAHMPQFLANVYERAVTLVNSSSLQAVIKESCRKDLFEIVLNGTLAGKNMLSQPGRWRFTQEYFRRAHLMSLYIHYPDFARTIVNEKVIGAHGSSSASLIGVLDHGIRPQQYLKEAGIPVASGEGIFGAYGLNDVAVSFAQWNDERTLKQYSGEEAVEKREEDLERIRQELIRTSQGRISPYKESMEVTALNIQQTLDFLRKPNKTPAELEHEKLIRQNFPVIYFISQDNLNKDKVITTDMNQEFALRDGVAQSDIKIICAPKKQLDFVREKVSERSLGIKVFPLEEYQTRTVIPPSIV